jgi:hypothetical protein
LVRVVLVVFQKPLVLLAQIQYLEQLLLPLAVVVRLLHQRAVLH